MVSISPMLLFLSFAFDSGLPGLLQDVKVLIQSLAEGHVDTLCLFFVQLVSIVILLVPLGHIVELLLLSFGLLALCIQPVNQVVFNPDVRLLLPLGVVVQVLVRRTRHKVNLF